MYPLNAKQNISDGIRRLGIFNAFFGSAVLYNSIVFRVVAGVLGGLPADTVAIVTMLEYWIYFALDVPFGYFADRFGRVRSTIIGLWCIVGGLSCCYAALITESGTLQTFLIYLDGILIGLGRSMMSGSFQAFYEDAIRRYAGDDSDLLEYASASFTKSSEYGRYFYLVATAFALLALYFLDKSIGIKHSFIIGISIYLYVIFHVTRDYRFLGEKYVASDTSFLNFLFDFFLASTRSKQATLIRSCFQLLNSVMSGYLIVTLLRHAKATDLNFYWPLLLSFTIATALSSIVKGYLLRNLYHSLGEKWYVILFFLIHFAAAAAMFAVSNNIGLLAFTIAVFFYTLIFYVAQAALGLVSVDILNSVTDSAYRATALSIFNMPGFLIVGIYSCYLTLYGDGAPGLTEIFPTAVAIAGVGMIVATTLAGRR